MPAANRLRTEAHSAPQSLRMHSVRVGDTHVIELAGELDLTTAADVDREVRRVEHTSAHVVAIDLHDLTFIDSTGIRVMVQAQRRSIAGGGRRLAIVKGTEPVQRLFDICGVAATMPFVDRLA
jgi:anti-anti-sigma factor